MPGMNQRPLGSTGLTVSELGFGCGSVGGLMVRGDPADQRRAVARALDAGITYFDTAPSYGGGRSEENLGRTLRDLDAWDRVVVGTKVRLSPDDLAAAPAAIRRSIEQSLERLGRDAVDLLQLHNPIAAGTDGSRGLPIDEVLVGVLDGLQQVVTAGLARHAGFTGTGDAEAIKRVIRSGRIATVQSYFNALNPSSGFAGASGGALDFGGIIDDAAALSIGVIAIRVMAAGALSGTAGRAANASGVPTAPLVAGGDFEQDVARTHRLTTLAKELGLESTLELGVRFALSKPGISTVLVGYSDLHQLEQAIAWTERGPLPDEAVQQIVAAAS